MSKLQTADFELLRKILFPDVEGWLVYAPNRQPPAKERKWYCATEDELRQKEEVLEKYVLFNLTDEPIQSAKAVAIVSVGQKRGAYQFAFLCNPDGTIRWLYPNEDRSAYFLHLYSASGWRGTLLKQTLKWGHGIGLGAWLRHGIFSIELPRGTWQPTHLVPSDYSFAIFTGTKGENRKAVVAAGTSDRPEYFLKIPLTNAAHRLVQNEAESLRELEKASLQTWVIPTARFREHVLELTNVQPPQLQSSPNLGALHFQAIDELWSNSEKQVLRTSLSYQNIETSLETLSILTDHPDMDQQQLTALRKMVSDEWHDLNSEAEWSTSLARGDFTPWNMFVGEQQLHVFDWELARFEPLGYDLFHFVLQSGCLIHRQSASQIRDAVHAVCTHSIWQAYPGTDPYAHWRYYLLRHISYYLPLYLQQAELHEQVHWQLKLWCELLALVEA